MARRPRAARRSARPRAADLVRINRALWERTGDAYDRRHGSSLAGARAMAWGLWRVPETELRLLGPIRGRRLLEMGCGAGRWAGALARRGAEVVGLDITPAQLAKARHESGRPHWIRANAERLPFAERTFDLVFADWGAFTFADPARTVPEAGRVLRPGGRLVFVTASPIRSVVQDRGNDRLDRRLRYDYFGLGALVFRRPVEANFQRTYGEWVRLFRGAGLWVDRLEETRPRAGARSSYLRAAEERWARRWPLEAIWSLIKSGAAPPRGPNRRSRAASSRAARRNRLRRVPSRVRPRRPAPPR